MPARIFGEPAPQVKGKRLRRAKIFARVAHQGAIFTNLRVNLSLSPIFR